MTIVTEKLAYPSKMSMRSRGIAAVALALALIAPASAAIGQTPPSAGALSASQPLFDFKTSDIKFNLETLMAILRDNQHEGWVLAVYPDPVTSRPLVGAGFSLDVAATDHPQLDLFNPRSFLEPSSAQLWQAAGFEPDRLQRLLAKFDEDMEARNTKPHRRKIKPQRLPPVITDEEATRLLRISAIQSVHNARAYCRDFDRLTASQQLALSQLVFQMGVNLQEFVQFLSALNYEDLDIENVILPPGHIESQREHWQFVQQTLIDSQWAKRFTIRAVDVIAMFDLDYADDPVAAKDRIRAVLRPPTKHPAIAKHPRKRHS